MAQFYEDSDPSKLNRLANEFNTLSIIYNKPQEKFLKEDILKIHRKAEKYKEKIRKEKDGDDGEEEEEETAQKEV